MQRKFFLLACFLFCAQCFAQQYPFVYYTPKDGLINSRVRIIKQDAKGRMYFLTHGGLSVYDGKRFTNYHTQDGLANELVNDLVEVGPDSFLLATNISTLNTLVRGRIGVFKPADNFCPVINRFFKSHDGYWYAAADEGLFRLDNNRFIKLPIKDGQGTEIGCCLDKIIEWKNYLVLIPWNNDIKEKLIVYDRISGKVTDIETKIDVTVNTASDNGQLWISTVSGPLLIDTAALSLGKIRFLPIPQRYQAFTVKKDMLVLFDAGHKAWFCGDGSIHIYSPGQTQVIKAGEAPKTYAITDLFIDKEGTMWMATDGNGIMKLRNTNVELINNINHQSLACQGITQQKDTIWFYNILDNAIYRHNDNAFTRYPLGGKPRDCNLMVFNNNRMYRATSEKIISYDNKDDPASYLHPRDVVKEKSSARFGQGLIDRYGTIIQYGVEDNLIYKLFALKDEILISSHVISHAADQMALDKNGRLWFTTRDHRIYAFSLHPEQPARYLQLEEGYPKQLPHFSPRSLTIDTSNNVWIGTRYDGIYRYEAKDTQLIEVAHYTTQHGLTDNFVITLAHDSNNTIWAGTQTGIDKIYKKKRALYFRECEQEQ
jgi:streptogramin lyase